MQKTIYYENRNLALLSSKFHVGGRRVLGQKDEVLKQYDYLATIFSPSFLSLPRPSDLKNFYTDNNRQISWRIPLENSKPQGRLNARVRELLTQERRKYHQAVCDLRDGPLTENDYQKLNILNSISFNWDKPNPEDIYYDGVNISIINWGITNNKGINIVDKKIPAVKMPTPEDASATQKFKIFSANYKWFKWLLFGIPLLLILLWLLLFFNADPSVDIVENKGSKNIVFDGNNISDWETEYEALDVSWKLFKKDSKNNDYLEVPFDKGSLNNNVYTHSVNRYGFYKIAVKVGDTGNRFTGLNKEFSKQEIEFNIDDNTKDCAGIPGGNSQIDECGICEGEGACLCLDGEMDCSCCCPEGELMDCLGVCDGNAIFDCAGECNGSAVKDACGVCDGEAIDISECGCIKDCLGICDGSAVTDCNGKCNGDAVIDVCGVCNGGITNPDKCETEDYKPGPVEILPSIEVDEVVAKDWTCELRDEFNNYITKEPNSVELSWPLVMSDKEDQFESWAISVYFDHDKRSPNRVKDYKCLDRTYDMDGYNHLGTDIMLWPFSWDYMDEEKVSIVAAADGIVVYVHDGEFDKNCGFTNGAVSNTVTILHRDGSMSLYAHLKSGSVQHSKGDEVLKGELIGYVGSSGMSTGPHLHFEYMDSDCMPVDPYFAKCNDDTNRSSWEEQKDYYLPEINLIATHTSEPQWSECYYTGGTNEESQFYQGDFIYFSAFGRDVGFNKSQKTIKYTILDPQQEVYHTWIESDIQTSPLYVFGNWVDFPEKCETGIYTYQVEFNNQNYSVDFQIKDISEKSDEEKIISEKEWEDLDPEDAELSASSIIVIGACEDEAACNTGEVEECIYPAENWDCEGNCILEIDCNDDCGGTRAIDECGVCSQPESEDWNKTCVDCNNEPNGINKIDECGVCDDNPDNNCVQDCDGVWGGEAKLDICGICNGENKDKENCPCSDENPADCNGVCKGESGWIGDQGENGVDQCGECGGDDKSCLDCNNIPNGLSVEDECGTCDDDPSNDCVADCDGVYGGNKKIDECGQCKDQNDKKEWNSSCKDCKGVPNGLAVKDDCGVCEGENKSLDCLGTCNGKAVIDCFGECNGGAKEDECGVCDGPGIEKGKCDCDGNVMDMCGDCGGDAEKFADCLCNPQEDENCQDDRVYVQECRMLDSSIDKFKKLDGWLSCSEASRKNIMAPWNIEEEWWIDSDGNRIEDNPLAK